MHGTGKKPDVEGGCMGTFALQECNGCGHDNCVNASWKTWTCWSCNHHNHIGR